MKSYAWIIIALLVAALAVYALMRAPQGSPGGGTASTTSEITATFYCGAGNTIQATFASRSVALILSDGRPFSLPQTISGSGARYESTTTGADIVFWNKGDGATMTASATTTDFRNAECTAARIEPSSTSGLDTYTDQSRTFTFAFPTAFSPAGTEQGYSTAWSAGATTTGMQLAKIDVSRSFEPGTNFANAWFMVGTSADPSAVATCLTNPVPYPNASTTNATIGGVPFTELTYGGAGAGNRYDTTSYRTVKDGECYAVEYTIHYGVFENYPPGAVRRFDEAKVQAALDAIAQSFRFLP